MRMSIRYTLLLVVVAGACSTAYAGHDDRCNPDVHKVCVEAETPMGDAELILRCVESGPLDLPIRTPVTWLKNGVLFEPDGERVEQLNQNELFFKQLVVGDEANWACFNGSSVDRSPEYELYAGRVNVLQKFTNLSYTIGDNFTMSCNIEVGANTARTGFTVDISMVVVFHSRDNITEHVLSYNPNNVMHAQSVFATRNTTSYTFHPSNLTTDVVNFSLPHPEEVRGVKYTCSFYAAPNGQGFSEETTTAVIPGFRPVVITKNLSDVTIVTRGSSQTFSVTVDSHPSPSSFQWTINDEIIANVPSKYVVSRPNREGNISTYNLTILNINEEEYGTLRFKAKLANSFPSTETLLIGPPQLASVGVTNGCHDVAYGEGPLNFNLLLRSRFPALRRYGRSLRVQLQLNWTSVAEVVGQNRTSITSMVDVTDSLDSDWPGGRRVSLAVNRSQAVPTEMVRRIRKDQRYRIQVRVLLNGMVASDWSPQCDSPVIQTCLESSTAEIKLRLMFSGKPLQCSNYTPGKVKTAIQTIFDDIFSCDNITISNVEQYHCDQQRETSIFRAKVTAYRAQNRVQQFYSVLRRREVSLFNESVVIMEESSSNFDLMVLVYVVTSLALLIMVAIVLILAIKICKNRSSGSIDVKSKEDDAEEGRGSPNGSVRSQNIYVEESRLSTKSPTSIMSSDSSSFAHGLSGENSHPLSPDQLRGDSVSAIVNGRDNIARTRQSHDQWPVDARDYTMPQLPGRATMPVVLSEQDFRRLREHQSGEDISTFGGDDISWDCLDRRQAHADPRSFDPRGTPSSGYQSGHVSRQQKSRTRHYTDDPQIATMNIVHMVRPGDEFIVLHGLNLQDRQSTNSMTSSSARDMGTPRLVRVQQATARSSEGERAKERSFRHPRSRAAEEEEGGDTRSRENLRLKLQNPVGLLRTVVPHEVVSPQRRYSDPSPLTPSPREQGVLGRDGYFRQDTRMSSEQDTSIL